eukprot:CAMPEP_0176086410 /NCGR_PEP_ID=MMETSP0120_2-20121206/43254_1 /TAXON_ID=160619 /ORGANISM="Kryptoperidinium foliaceum, Strain CCMP 1326" /LENGTH=261 /DNA_ID=CAMNT_0017420241 /DNA_START=89 /DNA_END=872 /DNA_ORIENTATION=-
MAWSTVDEAVAVFKRGGFVCVMDSEDREDECDLCWAAETVTTEQMAFAIRHTTGIVCICAEQSRLEHFGLHPATARNTDSNQTNFYVSTDFLPGTTTGCSAADRAATARAMCDLKHSADEFSKPGHLFPLCVRRGGVLERPGHTESTYDLCRLAGMTHVGLLAELMHDDGSMYRKSDALEFARKHGLPIITVEQLIVHCRRQQQLPLAPVCVASQQSLLPQSEMAGGLPKSLPLKAAAGPSSEASCLCDALLSEANRMTAP